MGDVDPDQINVLLRTWNELTDSSKWILLLIILVVIILFAIKQYLVYKSMANIEVSKQKRAQLYNNTLLTLSNNINNFTKDQKIMIERIAMLLEKTTDDQKIINENVKTTRTLMAKILSNQEGILDRRFSIKIIEHYFVIVIYTAVAEIFEKSLRENDFSNRQEFIANKVRTKIGDIIDNSVRELKEFNFSIDIDPFFELDKGVNGKRYILIDNIWNSVKIFYLQDKPLDQRCEESKLLISFIIKDYFNNKATEYLHDSGLFVAQV